MGLVRVHGEFLISTLQLDFRGGGPYGPPPTPGTSEAVQEAGTRRVNHFTVGARHMNISMVFLTQIIFVTDEYFKQIS